MASPITIKLVVNDVESVLSVFDEIKVYRSTTGVTGTYTEVTSPATRIRLETGVTLYKFVDYTGSADHYYRSTFYRSAGPDGEPVESEQSDPVAGEGHPALDVMSVEELKTIYLFGIDLTDDAGRPYPDSLYEHYIKAAVRELEDTLDIAIAQKTLTEEPHDYRREDFEAYMWVNLVEYPVLSVSKVQLRLPGQETGAEIDSSWIHVDKDSGQLQIVPGIGGFGTLLTGIGASLLYSGARARYIPDVVLVDYVAGFDPVPADIKELVGKLACFGPLNIAGDLLGGAGIAAASVSIDGLSQSFSTTSSATNAGYGARLLQYGKEIKRLLPILKGRYKGLRIAVA